MKIFSVILFIFALLLYTPKPINPKGIDIFWRYKDEVRVYALIKSQVLENYNISHLAHDNIAVAQKYLHLKDKTIGLAADYYNNQYLFTISDDSNFDKYTAYEIRTFTPRKILKTWKINEKYNLYLLERINR